MDDLLRRAEVLVGPGETAARLADVARRLITEVGMAPTEALDAVVRLLPAEGS